MIFCTSAETLNGLCMMNHMFILHIFCMYSVQIFFQYYLYQYFKTFHCLCCNWKYFLFLHYLFLKCHTSIAYMFVKYNYNFLNKINCSKTDICTLLYIFEIVLYFHENVDSLFWLQLKKTVEFQIWCELMQGFIHE